MKKTLFEQEKIIDLIAACEEIMLQGNNKSISIAEICEKANVHRQTFYYYFKSRDQFIKTLIYYKTQPLFEEIEKPEFKLRMFIRNVAIGFVKYNKPIRAYLSFNLLKSYFLVRINDSLKLAIKKEYQHLDQYELDFIAGGISHFLFTVLSEEKNVTDENLNKGLFAIIDIISLTENKNS
ncbi:MAG: TetR/AcrR family transcriptional regulator [Bacilli bacterium]